VVCDESSILKAFDGTTRAAVTQFMRKVPYRLLGTATAAPNDFIELGTSSEALGYLGFMDMLSRFFKNNRNNSATNRVNESAAQWRFRGHAERPFWRWVCSWARSLRKPVRPRIRRRRFKLPPLDRARAHRQGAPRPPGPSSSRCRRSGSPRSARSGGARCASAARWPPRCRGHRQPAVAWAHLNDEADLLERLIPGAIQVSGRDSDEEKEEKFNAFGSGQARVLVTKPVIGAWGLNWQHCAHMTTFAGHSFEQYYQSVRRFWRFGQTREVVVDHVVSDGEHRVLKNLQRKAEQAERLFAEITAAHARRARHRPPARIHEDRGGPRRGCERPEDHRAVRHLQRRLHGGDREAARRAACTSRSTRRRSLASTTIRATSGTSRTAPTTRSSSNSMASSSASWPASPIPGA
jgi:hypothetical protein